MMSALIFGLLVGAWIFGRTSKRSLRSITRSVTANEAAPPPGPGLSSVPLILELIGTAIGSGLPLVRALDLVQGVADEELRVRLRTVIAGLQLGTPWDAAWQASSAAGSHAPADQLRRALDFAAATGAPSAILLYAEAARLRRTQHRLAQKRAASLGVRLVLPLGLCFLPAFIALGVVPVVISLIPTFAGTAP